MRMPGSDRSTGDEASLLRALEEMEQSWPEGSLLLCAVRDAEGALVDFECLYANPAAEAMHGQGTLRGQRVSALASELSGEDSVAQLGRVLETGQPAELAVSGRTPSGETLWFQCTVVRLGERWVL